MRSRGVGAPFGYPVMWGWAVGGGAEGQNWNSYEKQLENLFPLKIKPLAKPVICVAYTRVLWSGWEN